MSGAAGAGSLDVTTDGPWEGNSLLEAGIGSTCVAPDNLVITGSSVNTLQTACQTITAGAPAGVQVVNPGATFQAGETIILKDSFSVASDAPFVARIDSSSTPYAYVQDNSPASETTYNALFYLRLNSLSLDASDRLEHFVGYSSDGTPWFQVTLVHNDNLNEDRLILEARHDGNLIDVIPGNPQVLDPGWRKIEISWRRGSGSGVFQVSIDDGAEVGRVNLNNNNGRIDHVRWGAVSGDIASSSGNLDLDDFSSWR